MTEDQWWQRHKVLTNEVNNTIYSFYTWLYINDCAGADESTLRRMNQESTFWITCSQSLQTNFIITIGRVFDSDTRSHSIQKLLSEAVAHPEFFSKEALARKKHNQTEPEPAWLVEFLRNSWAPGDADLDQLCKDLDWAVAKYDEVYRPIRHKMFAHKDVATDAQALLGKSLIADIEKILYSLHDTLESLWQLGFNGAKPEQGTRQYDYKDRIKTSTSNVMARLTASA